MIIGFYSNMQAAIMDQDLAFTLNVFAPPSCSHRDLLLFGVIGNEIESPHDPENRRHIEAFTDHRYLKAAFNLRENKAPAKEVESTVALVLKEHHQERPT